MKKKILSFLTMLCMVTVLMVANIAEVSAYYGTKYGNYLYYTVSNGEITISDCDGTATKITIPSEINGYPVISIGAWAFSDCHRLISITIPDSVTSIDERAFQNCSSLISITIPSGVTSIGGDAFLSCSSLTSIDVNENNKNYCSIDGNLFNKSKMELIQYPIGKSDTQYSIPSGVTSIGDSAFSDCSSLTSITIPNSVTGIGEWAFYNCSSLTSITIPNSVTSIDNYAFLNCKSLTNVTISDSVTYIGNKAFCDCSSLTSITIPSGVTGIGELAFSDCSRLTSINVDHNNEKYCSVDGNLFNKAKTELIQYAVGKNDTQYTIPAGVTKLDNYAFCNCKSLTNVTIPNSVTSIGYRMFSGCSSLASVIIPDSVTSIGYRMFEDCSSLTSITIPNSVTSIGNYAFSNCSSLENVNYNGNSTTWDVISISSGNDYLKNATRNYFYYVTIFDENNDVIVNNKNNIHSEIDLTGTEKIGYTIHLYTDEERTAEVDCANTLISENSTFYAKYTLNKYLHKFVNYDGTVISENTVDYGTQISLPNEIPSKPADDQYSYTFSEWDGYTEGITQVAEDMVFTAKYTSTTNQYSYKFVDEDGTVLKEETIDYGAEIVPPENPSKESTAQFNYTFTGWDGYTEGMTQTAEELVFYATYSVATNKYTYKFVDDDGTVLKEKTVNYNTMITAPTSPTKDATAQYIYTFDKWDGFTAGMKITQNVTFTAVYNATTNRYTYKFVKEDGSTVEEKTVDYGTEIIVPDVILEKASTDKYTYTHIGWNGYTSGMTIAENITFTPIFDSVINKYSYKFVDEDGTVLKEATVDFDTVITAPENPAKDATQQYTYSFVGWDGFVEGTTQKAETMIFTAKYNATVNQYTYKFVDEDGKTLKELTVDYGTEIVAPENPTKASTDKYTYTFSKWNGYSIGMTVTDNITFTAEYSAEINKYTYKFIDHDGSVVKSGTLDYGTVIPTPATPDSYSDQQYTYVFASWKGYVRGTKITKNVEFTAKYSPIINQYTYVFTDENGNTLSEETVDYGTEIVAPDAPQKPSTDKYSYIFSGWTGYEVGMTLTDDVVFTPIYTSVINKYTYKFVDDDGEIIEEKTVDYESVITAPASPTKDATQQYTYSFTGWDGYTEGITQKAETMIFTAKYSKTVNQYTYKFVDEGGKTLKELSVDYGTKIVPPENPTKDATAQYSYKFEGWTGYENGMTVTDNITFTAVYSPLINQYTYKFIDNDGKVLKESTVDYSTVVELPEIPSDKDPYTFDYWDGYSENMTVESDISFTAVYKYKQYTVTMDELEKTQQITYADSYSLPFREIKDFIFKGYFTESDGKGTQLTDEDGNSIESYAFAKDITVYPYYVHSFANKFVITGTDSAQLGSENILQTVAFATDKNAKSLTCTVKYPEKFKLNVVSKDFVLANINSVETKDEYNYAYLTCMYDYAGSTIPINQTVTPFELSFAIEKDMALGEARIEMCDIVLRGNENYSLEETAMKKITILPKLAESIAITGADTIDKVTEFKATITPDYTYSKDVIWSVDDDKIAVISKDGILTPLKNGVVTITVATTDGSNISATKQVNVTAYSKIDSLSIAGVWDKEFSPDVNEYIVYVKEDVNNITVEANYTAGALFVGNVMLLSDMKNDFELKENSTILTFKRNNVANMTDSEYKITIVKFEGTKTTVSDDGTTFTVKPINIENGNTVILALYNGNSFVGMEEPQKYEGNDLTFITNKKYTNAKIMVWDSLDGMIPQCEAEIVNTKID